MQEVILDTDFGLQWVDWKIVEHLSNSSSSNGKINFQHRTFDSTVLRHIWKPDIFIGIFLSTIICIGLDVKRCHNY